MKRLILAAGLLALAACGPLHPIHLQSVDPATCPTDGTVFVYGSCTVPPGVADIPPSAISTYPGHETVGSLVRIADPVGCGLEVVPTDYAPEGTYVCLS